MRIIELKFSNFIFRLVIYVYTARAHWIWRYQACVEIRHNLMPLKIWVATEIVWTALFKNEAWNKSLQVNSGRRNWLPLDDAAYILYSHLGMSNFPWEVTSKSPLIVQYYKTKPKLIWRYLKKKYIGYQLRERFVMSSNFVNLCLIIVQLCVKLGVGFQLQEAATGEQIIGFLTTVLNLLTCLCVWWSNFIRNMFLWKRKII